MLQSPRLRAACGVCSQQMLKSCMHPGTMHEGALHVCPDCLLDAVKDDFVCECPSCTAQVRRRFWHLHGPLYAPCLVSLCRNIRCMPLPACWMSHLDFVDRKRSAEGGKKKRKEKRCKGENRRWKLKSGRCPRRSTMPLAIFWCAPPFSAHLTGRNFQSLLSNSPILE